MKQGFRIALLSSIITAAMVYVALEWRPLRPQPVSRPAEGVEAVTPDVTLASAPASAPLAEQEMSADERNNVDIYRTYSRGVVNITSTTLAYNFFLQPVPESGSGSGVLIDNTGNVLTNYHVIEGARRLEVTLWDQSKYEAQVVGADPSNDLAVIKIDAPPSDLVAIPLGSTEGIQVGQKVLAIGNPFGLEGTLTTGIISSLGRSIQAGNGRIIEGIIQTDAAINPGNSGGPLLNTSGEVIGINTAIVSPSNTGNIGISFAVPVETVKRVTTDLITYGRVRRVFMGFRGIGLDRLGQIAEALDLGTDSGVLVVDVIPGSPAERGGIRGATRQVRVGNSLIGIGGDVIVEVDGRGVNAVEEVSAALEPRRPGERIPVTVIRGKQQVDIELTLEEESP